MKQLYILAATLLLSISAFAQDGRSLYNKYSDYENVEAVYISPAMFRLIGKIPDVEMQGENVNLGPIIKSLSGLYILSIKEDRIAQDLYDDVNRFISKGQYELLMAGFFHMSAPLVLEDACCFLALAVSSPG